jgi:hypothetical protein
MANTLNNPTQGFQVFGRMEGASPTQGLTPVWIASTDASLIFRGDPVFPSSGGGTNLSGRYVTAVTNSSFTTTAGVFMGLEQYQPSVGRVVWSNFYNGAVTGSTGDVKAYICDDPDVMFLVQGSTSTAITSSFIGLNANFTNNSTTGNTTLGFSNVALASSTVGSSSVLLFRIVDFYSAFAPPAIPAIGTNAFINGTDNTTPANMVLVRMNNCERLNLTARSSS